MCEISIDQDEKHAIDAIFACNRFKVLFETLSKYVVKENGYGATGNTLRGFHLARTAAEKKDKTIKNNRECFDSWAEEQIVSDRYISVASTKISHRNWKYEQATMLQNKFKENGVKNAAEEKDVWRFVKLIDLFIKNRIFAEVNPDKKRILINAFEVPLDKYSLIKVRQSYNSSIEGQRRSEYPRMPEKVSMGWVKKKTQYELVQDIIKNISTESAFRYDVFAWNYDHLSGIENRLLDSLIEK